MAAAAKQNQVPAGAGGTVRSLRIGVLLGDKFIEERTLRTREDVTIGQSTKNFFSVPIEALPKSFSMFTVENGRYVLHLQSGMDARISQAGGQAPQTLEQLKSQGAQKRGDGWAIVLEDTARGRVQVNELKLLFQFVNAPPIQPKPRLPASVRGSLAEQIDLRLAIILAISLTAHMGVAIWALLQDLPVANRIDAAVQKYQEEAFRERQAKVYETKTADVGTKPAEKKSEDGGKSKEPKGGGEAKDPGKDSGAPSDAQVDEMIANTAVLSVLTGGEGGDRYGKTSEHDQGAGLNQSLANAAGKDVSTIGGGAAGHSRGDGTGQIGGGKGGGVGGPGAGEGVGQKDEEQIAGRVSLGKTDIDDLSGSTLDPDLIYRAIMSRYLAGIRRCYQTVLKRDGKAQGRINLRITVAPTGSVSKAAADGFDSEVDACVERLARGWRFSAPKDDDGKPMSADFQFPLVLKPGQ